MGLGEVSYTCIGHVPVQGQHCPSHVLLMGHMKTQDIIAWIYTLILFEPKKLVLKEGHHAAGESVGEFI